MVTTSRGMERRLEVASGQKSSVWHPAIWGDLRGWVPTHGQPVRLQAPAGAQRPAGAPPCAVGRCPALPPGIGQLASCHAYVAAQAGYGVLPGWIFVNRPTWRLLRSPAGAQRPADAPCSAGRWRGAADVLDLIADKLNRRPRQTLESKTPSQALAEVLRRPPEPAPMRGVYPANANHVAPSCVSFVLGRLEGDAHVVDRRRCSGLGATGGRRVGTGTQPQDFLWARLRANIQRRGQRRKDTAVRTGLLNQYRRRWRVGLPSERGDCAPFEQERTCRDPAHR